MIALHRFLLSASLLASMGAPAVAQVDLPLPPPAPAASPLPSPAARIQIAADPRIELMSLLLSRTRQGKLQQDDVAIAYRAAAANHFKAFDAHPAVKLLEDLQAQGFEGAHPYRFALLLSSPSMALDTPLPPDLAAQAEKLGALANAMRAYAAESRFMDFYASQTALYAGIAKKIDTLLKVDDVAGRVEEFYGTSWDRYTIHPAPLMTRSGDAFPVIHADGSREVIVMLGPLGATSQQEPDYGQPQALFLAFEKAIGKVIVPGLTAKYAPEIAETQELFAPLSERLAARGVTTWSEAVDQHLLRAVGARLLQARGKVREAQLDLHQHERRGYWYVRKYFDLLALYQADRKTYPTFESFYPRLVATMSFWKDAGEHQRIDTAAKRFIGPISAASEARYLQRTVLIRPEPKDPEQRKLADAFVKNLVSRYRERYGITLPVMTSLQAAAADPAQTVFLIYGTPDSNGYLKALLKYLPIKVSKGDLHLGAHQFRGADLRLVTALPNPYNPELPFRIVTGSTDEIVFADLALPHTQSDFVIYRGGKLFQQGDFLYEENGAWRVP